MIPVDRHLGDRAILMSLAATAYHATVCGGAENIAGDDATTPDPNVGRYSVVGGGQLNVVTQQYGTVTGGYSNTVAAQAANMHAWIGGGWRNIALGQQNRRYGKYIH